MEIASKMGKLLFAAGSIAFAMSAFGQASATPPQNTGARTFAYDTVSVHPCKTGSGMSIQMIPNRYSARCITLWGLIYNSFDVRPSASIPGLPSWANSAQFDVEAIMDDETFAALQKLPREQQGDIRRGMLRAIMADRFKLTFHHETREQPIYALVIAKGGPKLSAGQKEGPIYWRSGQIEFHGGSVGTLAFTLADSLGREVVDKTGLTGKYDVKLTWTPDEQQGSADAGPTLFTAIQEQLGLKLESTKGPVDTIVFDHVEKPTEN